MTKNDGIYYNQGKSFPSTGQGAGLIFGVVGLIFFFATKSYWPLLLCYPSLWLSLSKTYLDTSKIEQNIIIRKFGFFPFIFSRKIRLENYDAGLVKVERVKYRTTQSMGYVSLGSQETSDQFMALSLKVKGKYEYETLYKESREKIMEFIQDNLKNTELRFFNGVLKKEHEIEIN